MLTALSRLRLHCSLLGAVAFDSKGGDQIKTGLKVGLQTCVGKCQTINLIDLVFMLQKMSKHIQVLLKMSKHIQVLLSVFCTLDVWKPVMGYANQTGYAI